MPVYNVMLDFERGWHDYKEWLDAIDTFGPDGSFAFPPLPGDQCEIKVGSVANSGHPSPYVILRSFR